MSKSDAEVIKMLLWLVIRMLSKSQTIEMVSDIGIGLHAVMALIMIIVEVTA